MSALALLILAIQLTSIVRHGSASKFVEYIPGEINLILTSPHGGEVIADNMRDRRPGCYDEATGVCTYDSSRLDCESSVSRPTIGMFLTWLKLLIQINFQLISLSASLQDERILQDGGLVSGRRDAGHHEASGRCGREGPGCQATRCPFPLAQAWIIY